MLEFIDVDLEIFLLKPELLRAIVDSGFEHPSEADEFKPFVKAVESIGFVHQGSIGPTFGEAYRDNYRIALNDPVLADALWESGGLSNLFAHLTIRGKVPVGLNPNIRLYRLHNGLAYMYWIPQEYSSQPFQTLKQD